MPPTDVELIRMVKAVDYAAKAHRLQLRKDGETPYINHPAGVARILTEEGKIFDIEAITVAYLHDVIEDCNVTEEQLALEFGSSIASLVKELSDDRNLSKSQRREMQLNTVAKLTPKAKLVRMADKIYNLRDLNRCRPKEWTAEQGKEYWNWSKLLFEKGLRGQNSALEAILEHLFRDKGFPDDVNSAI